VSRRSHLARRLPPGVVHVSEAIGQWMARAFLSELTDSAIRRRLAAELSPKVFAAPPLKGDGAQLSLRFGNERAPAGYHPGRGPEFASGTGVNGSAPQPPPLLRRDDVRE
jgi:hypothetical protein